MLSALCAFAMGCDSGSTPEGATVAAPSGSAPPVAEPEPEPERLDDEALVKLYEEAKAQMESGKLDGLEIKLRKVIDGAEDKHLRANAALFLGSLSEVRSDWQSAVSYYKLARSAVPEEPGTHAVLALALAKMERFAEAVVVQAKLVEMTPDDLQAWLILGEMRFKAGNEEGATQAYAGYEMRRTGLLDGLTLKKDGAYQASPHERVLIVQNLAVASDNGTALALLYALDSDPETQVGDAIAELMGMQRLEGYRIGLNAYLARAQGEESKKIAQWALDEITREAVDVRPGGAPWLPSADQKSAVDAPEKAPETATSGQDAAVPASP